MPERDDTWEDELEEALLDGEMSWSQALALGFVSPLTIGFVVALLLGWRP